MLVGHHLTDVTIPHGIPQPFSVLSVAKFHPDSDFLLGSRPGTAIVMITRLRAIFGIMAGFLWFLSWPIHRNSCRGLIMIIPAKALRRVIIPAKALRRVIIPAKASQGVIISHIVAIIPDRC